MRREELEETVENMGYVKDDISKQPSSYTTIDAMSSLSNGAKCLKNTLTLALILVFFLIYLFEPAYAIMVQ